MVKEGHDSTVRPTVQTYEFSGGRAFLDTWASDGKPNLSRRFIAWSRVGNVVLCTGMAAALIFAEDQYNQHTVVTDFKQLLAPWWRTFCELDVADVEKARSVGPGQLLPRLPPRARRSSDNETA